MISFIVPVKDGLPYTRALVESVRARNPEAAVEWVIVDSGSTDGTLEYCAEIGLPYHEVGVVRSFTEVVAHLYRTTKSYQAIAATQKES